MRTTEELYTGHEEQYDVFLSFTRASPRAEEQAARLHHALVRRKLRVFRDVGIEEFEGITAALVTALANSKVLVAYYTLEYPKRYACQWELTAAFLAAQRDGDPRRRVLVVNPEPGEPDHIRPIELADAKYAGEPRGADDFEELASRIAAQVAAVRGPLGKAPHLVGSTRLPPEALTPDLFIGRYAEMWDVHTALRGMDFPGVHQPAPESAVLLTGLPGAGKTSLARRYAYLYRDGYPGGVYWTGPFGGDPNTIAGRFTEQLRDIAEDELGLPVAGVEPDRLRRLVAGELNRAGRQALWVIDDVPPGLTRTELDKLLIPAHPVRTVLTSRAGVSDWDTRQLMLGGLAEDDALVLFGVSTAEERRAVRALVTRCGGHPMVIRSVANAVRYRPGPLNTATAIELIETATPTVAVAIKRDVDQVGGLARLVLRAAAVLAEAPFAPSLIREALGGPRQVSEDDIAAAVRQLVERGLLQLIGDEWSVHPLVSDAARSDADDPALATGLSAALLPLLQAGGRHLASHALRLGEHDGVPVEVRGRLLRHVVADHEVKGDPVGAREVMAKLLALPGAGGSATDLLTAARVYLACGLYQDAETSAREALALAEVSDDFRARHRARLLLAQALDQLGDQAEADRVCWSELGERTPGWLNADAMIADRTRTTLALASAYFLRGRPLDARAIVEPMVTELRAAAPGPLRDDLKPAAELELARLLQLTGESRIAREVARGVVSYYRELGMTSHARLLDAEGVWADAFLTLDLTELDGKPADWQHSVRKLRGLAGTYAEKWGEHSPIAIGARARAARALLAVGKPRQALSALAEVEAEIIDQLGRHRLLFRVRYAMAQAHGQLREFARQRDILRAVLPDQAELLGRYHPETLETQLDLGVTLAMTGNGDEAVAMVDEAAKALRRGLGMKVDLSGRATTAQGMVRLPYIVLRTVTFVEQFFGAQKKTE
jgi:hypothetical protein